jgi:hypothetical protein
MVVDARQLRAVSVKISLLLLLSAFMWLVPRSYSMVEGSDSFMRLIPKRVSAKRSTVRLSQPTFCKMLCKVKSRTEPVFVNLSRSLGIYSRPGGPVRQPSLTYPPARLSRLAKLMPWNRFLGALNVNKYGLWIYGAWHNGVPLRFWTVCYFAGRKGIPSILKT